MGLTLPRTERSFSVAIAFFELTFEKSQNVTLEGGEAEIATLPMLGLRIEWFQQNFHSSQYISKTPKFIYGALLEGLSSVETNPPLKSNVTADLGFGVIVGETKPAAGRNSWVVVKFADGKQSGFQKKHIMDNCHIIDELPQDSGNRSTIAATSGRGGGGGGTGGVDSGAGAGGSYPPGPPPPAPP